MFTPHPPTPSPSSHADWSLGSAEPTAQPALPRTGEGWGVRALPVLAALLTWLAVLCAILIVAWPRMTIAGGLLDVRMLALAAALAVAVTLGLTSLRAPAAVGYVVAHLAGVTLLLGVMQGLGLLAVTFPRAAFPWGPPRVALAPGATPFSIHAGTLTPTTAVVLSLGITWELAYAATWLVVRERRPWLALALVVATPLLTARPRGSEPLFVALSLVGLAIVAVTAARERRRPALTHGARAMPLAPRLVALSPGLRLALALLVPLSGALTAAAWFIPIPDSAPAVRSLRAVHPPPLDRWTQAARTAVARIGVGGGHAGDASNAAGLALFGQDLPVGGAFRPDNTPVLLARVADPSRSPYWRGALYDRYAGGTWRALPARRVRVPAGAPLGGLAGVATGAPITQEIDLLRPSDVLFTAGPPLRVGVTATVSLAGPAPGAMLAVGPPGGATTGVYTAVSAAAPTAPLSPSPALPPALRALDLALPPLPKRVQALARQLMSYSDDPYTRAWDIQWYLHTKYRYDTAPPAAPAGQDPVDYFLFDARRGFCTHFATAMVVLARAAGIPARLVTGYAAGHLVGAHFVVTTADAHAWPELFIGGRGWVTFEPTPSFPIPFQTGLQPVVTPFAGHTPPPATAGATDTLASPKSPVVTTTTRLGATATAAVSTPGIGTGTGTPTPPAPRNSGGSPGGGGSGGGGGLTWPRLPRLTLSHGVPPAVPLAALTLVVLACGVAVVRRRAADAATLYGRMCRLAGRLGAAPSGGQTPLEWAAALATRSPGDGSTVLTLTDLYVRQRYGGGAPAPEDLMVARASWRALRRRWRRRLLTRRTLA